MFNFVGFLFSLLKGIYDTCAIHMNKKKNNLTPTLFNLKIIIFLAHDEPTNWIPPSLKFPPSQPPNSIPNYPTFCFPAT